MSWSLVASTSKAAGANPTTSAINTTGADLIVLITALDGTTLPSVSDSLSNTWTNALASAQNRIGIWYCQSPTTGSAHTFSATTSFSCLLMAEAWSGSTSSPLDQTASGTITNAASAQPGAITPSVNDELIISAVWVSGSVTSLAVDSSLTIDQSNLGFGADAYLVQATAASINPTWSWTTSRNSVAAIASFKPAGGGTPTNVDPGAGSVIFTGEAPTVAAGTAVNPGAGSIIFTGAAPSLVWDNALMPGAGSVRFNGQQPTVTGGTPSVTNIQLIAKRGHQTPGQPLGFV